MRKYLVRRLLNMLPTLILVSLGVFALVRWLPSDPARLLAGVDDSGAIDPALYARITKELGLDQPIVVQYAYWLGGVVRGNWGKSYLSGMEVLPQIVHRLQFTVQLAIAAWLFGLLLGIPLGTISAVRRNSPLDIAVTAFAISGVAIPHFWLGMMLIVLFAVWLGWLPYGGFDANLFVTPGLWIKQMLLPTFVLGTGLAAILMRQTRAALLEVFREPYILTARSKGLQESRVIWTHAMKNSLLPVVTIASLQFGTLVGGTVVTETVFTLPGLGKFVVDAVLRRDYLVVQMGLLVLTMAVMFSNFIADVVYTYLDPRIRYD
ncbi:MAG: ABC transporter permease [Candidatus Tectomicrobia bacterium]|uniref:ABC transporter permease n=1 Tax=Tectimicrobiota bacterium TaxID=2528274 RepID=A0A938B062_UNCTE|nr:ABC transporter permease [Candidatus Tectomicrobia bacterium]